MTEASSNPTAIGLSSLLAYLVVLRRHETTVRLAVGATPNDVLRLVLRNVTSIVGAGISLGLGGALVVSSWLRGLLFEVQPTRR